MKLELEKAADGIHQINAYSAGSIVISNVTYRSSLIVSSNTVIEDWPPANFSDLSSQNIEQILLLSPELVILGTGAKLEFPATDITAPLTTRHIGFEVMDTGAACRAFNFLTGEGRKVAAALFMI